MQFIVGWQSVLYFKICWQNLFHSSAHFSYQLNNGSHSAYSQFKIKCWLSLPYWRTCDSKFATYTLRYIKNINHFMQFQEMSWQQAALLSWLWHHMKFFVSFCFWGWAFNQLKTLWHITGLTNRQIMPFRYKSPHHKIHANL